MKQSKNILVNATASFSGGALTILKQFLDNLKEDDGNQYTVFGMPGLVNKKNVRFIEKDTQLKRWQRVKWELFGMQKWIKRNKYDLLVSFQNTGIVGAGKIPQLIYYHQPVALSSFGWSPFKKRERLLFFYQRIYPLIVSILFTRNTYIVVQLQSIRDAFIKKFSFTPERVFVCRPSFNMPDIDQINRQTLNDPGKIHFLYPFVQMVPYKNYEILFEAIRQMDPAQRNRIRLHFTCRQDDLSFLQGYDDIMGNIIFHNRPSYNALMALYNSVDAVLFPSFIETFGLPLLEAAAFGIPVCAADMPYAREVLEGYESAVFVPYNNIKQWKEVMNSTCKLKERKVFKGDKNVNEWPFFFEIINRL